jgi:hypothetical protein
LLRLKNPDFGKSKYLTQASRKPFRENPMRVFVPLLGFTLSRGNRCRFIGNGEGLMSLFRIFGGCAKNPYLGSEALRIEINEGLNVVENWNSANGFVFFGKGGEIATNRLEDQEIAVLSLHLLQACLVYINTLMLQQILADPAWLKRMTADDFRGLSPLIYAHVNPYGIFELDMTTRLLLETVLAA